MSAIGDYLAANYEELDPMAFYRELFPVGSFQSKGIYEKGSYNGILLAVPPEKRPDGSMKIRRYTVTDDLEAIAEAIGSDDFVLMAPISYAGKERTAENARFMFALAVDLDRIRYKSGSPVGLRNLLERHIADDVRRIPKPSFVVSSGTGVHVYYVLEKPIALFEDTAKQLQAFKHDLTDLIWHDTICDIRSKREIQQEGIYQGFRVVGSKTKIGDRARVFRIGDRVTMEYLNSFIKAEDHRVTGYREKRKLTIQQAKDLYPEWYERRVIRKEPKGIWHTSRRVYEWWKQQIIDGAVPGHRYYCLMMLAIYARKCGFEDPKHNPDPVTREELEADAWELMDHLERLTVDDRNHFTSDDVMAALQAYEEKWLRYPRKAIEYRSGITIPANKRNGRIQEEHMKRITKLRDFDYPDGSWRNVNGRPTAEKKVAEWQRDHPERSKRDCERETGLSRHTVLKWWDESLTDL